MNLFFLLGKVRLKWLLSAFLPFAFLSARAADQQIVQVTNTTGLVASDLHVTFTGTGGTVFVAPASVIAPPCPIPAVPSNGQVTNTVTIDWGMPCVAPGATVTFWVSTPNGPLGFAGANWTFAGVNIGPAWRWRLFPPPPPPPPPGGRPFWGIVRQTRCFATRPAIYTAWRRPPGGGCWRRWCCRPRIWYFTRLAMCFFVNRRGRLVNSGICIPISNWTYSFRTREKYRWRFRTIRPPDLGPQIIPINGVIHNGPPIRRANLNSLHMNGWGMSASNDNGLDWQPTMDFRSGFMNVAMALDPDQDVNPDLDTTVQKLMFYAPNFQSAAQEIERLRQAVLQVNAAEPGGDLAAANNALLTLRGCFNGIATQFASGILPTDASLWEQCRQATTNLGPILSGLMPARGPNIQHELNSLAEGFRKARDMVASGFPTMAEEDQFLYAVFDRILPGFESAAMTMGPHIAIQLAPMQLGWYPHLFDSGAVVHITGPGGQEIDQTVIAPSETNRIYIPIEMIPMELTSVRIGLKFDTHLSSFFDIFVDDGFLFSAPSMVNGDANGDDRIDAADQTMVQSAIGQGGPDAESLSSADVNADGIVDLADLSIVQAGLGQVGNAFRLVNGRVEFQDYGPDPQKLWHENFDSYLTGSQIIGQGGWQGWDNSPSANAQVVAGGLTPPNRIQVTGTTDIVQTFTGLTSGRYVMRAMQFVPPSSVGDTYFIIQNRYQHFGPYAWSVQLRCNASQGIIEENRSGPGPTLPLVTGQWKEVRCEIDLDFDTVRIYYDNQLLTTQPWKVPGDANALTNIGALDLYSAAPNSLAFYDDISLAKLDREDIDQIVQFEVRTPSGGVLETREIATSGEEYSFLTSRAAGEVVQITAKGSHWLKHAVTTTLGQTVTTVHLSMKNGDVDGDNEVTIGDFARLSASFGAVPGDLNYDEEADLNGDEEVTIGDYAIMSSNFGEVGD
ncbi:MAG TPA: dockerin type I domain-containing protein [Fimbriimonadaceae bacterium]|nr:dockerin type I domain-containing protein [Fimbriimonadaceae bacterium]HRJ95796.1 dockerin type I domain-containing protein [Fimbriimonadaceae bacterium]